MFFGRTDVKAETPILWPPHVKRSVDSLEKTLMLGEIGGRRKRGQPRMRWLDGITDSMDVSLNELCASAQEASGLWLPVSSKLVGFAWQKRAGADSHSGTNSHSTQIRPPLPLLSALPSLLCILAAFLLVWEGRPSSPHSQDLTLRLCCPGLALTFNSVQRGCPRCPIKSPPCRPLLPSGFTRSCCTDGMA